MDEDSILKTIKKLLGLPEDYDAFDQDLIIHINSVFSTLDQIGVGPANGFYISDETATWDHFFNEDLPVHHIKTYVYLKVRLVFDPPATSFAINAMENQAKELEWRLSLMGDLFKPVLVIVVPDATSDE